MPAAIAREVWKDCQCADRNKFAAKYTKLYENEFVQTYCREAKAIAEHMNENVPDFGLKSKGTLASAMSYYNMGIETEAMQAMYKAMPSATVPIHDAVLCSKEENFKGVEEELRLATGIDFELEVDRHFPSRKSGIEHLGNFPPL